MCLFGHGMHFSLDQHLQVENKQRAAFRVQVFKSRYARQIEMAKSKHQMTLKSPPATV